MCTKYCVCLTTGTAAPFDLISAATTIVCPSKKVAPSGSSKLDES